MDVATSRQWLGNWRGQRCFALEVWSYRRGWATAGGGVRARWNDCEARGIRPSGDARRGRGIDYGPSPVLRRSGISAGRPQIALWSKARARIGAGNASQTSEDYRGRRLETSPTCGGPMNSAAATVCRSLNSWGRRTHRQGPRALSRKSAPMECCRWASGAAISPGTGPTRGKFPIENRAEGFMTRGGPRRPGDDIRLVRIIFELPKGSSTGRG